VSLESERVWLGLPNFIHCRLKQKQAPERNSTCRKDLPEP
jgi:hypothetical protein